MIIRKVDQQAARKKAAAYCRVSTEKEIQLGSFEEQVAVYQEAIASNREWQFAGIYSDQGISGTSAEKRPGFMKMVQDAEAGKIDVILCKSISRFARNAIECQRYVEQLKVKNVVVIFEENNIRTDDPGCSFVFSLMATVAQDESRSISENLKWAIHNRFSEGKYNLGNNHILGYDTVDGLLVPNPDAWIVKACFRLFLEGMTYAQISAYLKKAGAKTLRGKAEFAPETIRCILTNETYVGDKQLQKRAPVNYLTKKPDPNENYETFYLTDDHEGIISRKTWEKTCAIFEERKRAKENGVTLGNRNSRL